jgi:hypothetical protein
MTLAIRWDRTRSPAVAILEGAIDEATQLEQLFGEIVSATLIDCSGVDRINSIGVNNWVQRFTVCAREHPLQVARLSYPLVMQANSVANLFEGAEIVSALAPYFCAACQTNLLLDVRRTELPDTAGAPARTCPDCKGPLEFDELDEYFNFLRRRR